MFLNFGGHELTEYIKILDVKRPLLASRVNYSVDIPSLNGEVYTGHKYQTKEIEVEFAILCRTNKSYFDFVRILGDILDTTEPTKLVIGDEPDKYYYAVLDGSTELDKILTNGFGSIKFLCHNPVAYSDTENIFEADAEGKVTVVNNGSAKTQPVINVQFSKDAHFLQVTNYTGEVILIGNRPKVDNTTVDADPLVLNEPCETTTNFTSTGNVLDSGREVTGNCTVNGGGYGICCANYGTGAKWHGGALRRNIGTNVDEFEVTVKVEHDSKGSLKGQGSNSTSTPSNNSQYLCTASPSLRVRANRGTSYKKVTSIPKGKVVTVTDISKGWGKVTYNGKTGYASMDYLKLQTNKTTKSTTPSAENRMGRLEVYGFDNYAQKLFKFVIRDSDEWYEYTEPEVFIGNKCVLSDGTDAPKPKTKTETDAEGNKTISNTDSGKFGKWNEFSGIFKIKRVLNGNNYSWSCEVHKYKDGKTVEKLVSNALSDSNYPKGALNHLVVWFGQWADSTPVDTMAVTDIKVKRLNKLPSTPVNQKIFRSGDEVVIDCENNIVYKNQSEYMSHLDIGSKFFSVGKGTSQFMVVSDDKNIDVLASITEKWL